MLKPIKLSEIPQTRIINSLIAKDVKEFAEASWVAAEIVIPAGKTAKGRAGSYATMCKKLNVPVKVIQRGQRLFFVKESALGVAAPKGGK